MTPLTCLAALRAPAAVLMLLLATASPAAHGSGATPMPREADAIRIDELLSDTQRTSSDPDSLDMVWWMVPQFWESVLAGNPDASPRVREEVTALFSRHIVVAAVKGQMGTLRVESFLDGSELRERIRIVDPRGVRHAPIPEAEVDPTLRAMFGAMQPMIADVVGQLGDNLSFFVFPATDAEGRAIADPLADGRFLVELEDVEYRFRLPLASLLVPRMDPGTGEEFPGNFLYNPYTGTRLAAPEPR
jgi:hypothetical protein